MAAVVPVGNPLPAPPVPVAPTVQDVLILQVALLSGWMTNVGMAFATFWMFKYAFISALEEYDCLVLPDYSGLHPIALQLEQLLSQQHGGPFLQDKLQYALEAYQHRRKATASTRKSRVKEAVAEACTRQQKDAARGLWTEQELNTRGAYSAAVLASIKVRKLFSVNWK